VATGVTWGVASAIVYQLVALGVQTALTYVLEKSQYGTYGKAFAVLGLAMLMQQLGFNEVLLRRGKQLRLWLGSAFWLALLLGFSGAGVLALVAVPLGRFYDDPQLTLLVLLATPLPIIRSLAVVPTVTLVAAMRFRFHYSLMLVSALATSLLTLGLAHQGFGSKAFIIAMLVVEPCSVAVLWKLARPPGWPGVRPSRWRFLTKDLRFVFGSNLSRWLRSSIDPLVLGIFATASVVGLYFFAQSIVLQIVRVVSLNLTGVLLPALNQLSDAPKRQTDAFFHAARVLLLIGAPACIGLGAIGPLFVRVFLDAGKWHDLPPVMSVLSIGMVFRLLDEPINALIAAQGRFRLGFRLSMTTGVAYVATCAAGAMAGDAVRTALAAATFMLVNGPLLLTIAIRPVGGSVRQALTLFAIPFLLSIAAILPWMLLDRAIPGKGHLRDVVVLACMIPGAAATYLLMLAAARPPGWHELLDRMIAIAPGRLKPAFSRIARLSY